VLTVNSFDVITGGWGQGRKCDIYIWVKKKKKRKELSSGKNEEGANRLLLIIFIPLIHFCFY
jgi:hypothetical protein